MHFFVMSFLLLLPLTTIPLFQGQCTFEMDGQKGIERGGEIDIERERELVRGGASMRYVERKYI